MRSVFVSAVLAASPALAQETHDAAPAAESGNFLPFSQSPNASFGYTAVLGGYDTARGGALLTSEFQARLHRRVYLLLNGDYQGPDGHALEPSVAGQVILFEQADVGVDVAIFAGWEYSGFPDEPDVVGRVAAGRRMDGIYLVANAAAGFAEEHAYGELTLGGIAEVLPHLYAGVDARGLEGSSTWEIQAGPVATVVSGAIEATVVADVSAFPGKTGAMTMFGLGVVF